MPLDLLCVGMAAYDLTFCITHQPGADEKMRASTLLQSGGGPAANAAVAAARLGLQSAFVGYLGQDLYGQAHLHELQAEGVDIQWVLQGSACSPISSIYVKPDGSRSVVNYRDVTPVIQFVKPKQPTHLKAILFDGHELQVSLALLEFAQAHQIPTILDAGSVHTGTEMLWNKVDYLVAAETFALPFTAEKTPAGALQQLLPLCRNVIITSGTHGLVYHCDGETGAMPAFHVAVVDSTGAGDAFHGGFATAVAEGKSIRESLRFASAVAALSCTHLGARPSLPYRNEVEAFLNARK